MPSAAKQAVDRELEAEEEEQEDDPELRDERRHLGRLDQARHVRFVRSEQQSRQQVGGDGGKAEPPRDEAERRQQGDRQGELRERHASVILRGPWLSRCDLCASAAASASPPGAPPSSAVMSARSAPGAPPPSSTSARTAAASWSRARGASTGPSPPQSSPHRYAQAPRDPRDRRPLADDREQNDDEDDVEHRRRVLDAPENGESGEQDRYRALEPAPRNEGTFATVEAEGRERGQDDRGAHEHGEGEDKRNPVHPDVDVSESILTTRPRTTKTAISARTASAPWKRSISDLYGLRVSPTTSPAMNTARKPEPCASAVTP